MRLYLLFLTLLFIVSGAVAFFMFDGFELSTQMICEEQKQEHEQEQEKREIIHGFRLSSVEQCETGYRIEPDNFTVAVNSHSVNDKKSQNIVSDFNLCLNRIKDKKIEHSSEDELEKIIRQCGVLLQTALDKRQPLNYSTHLLQLNNTVARLNLKRPRVEPEEVALPFLFYQLYLDDIPHINAARQIRLIQSLRTSMRDYRLLRIADVHKYHIERMEKQQVRHYKKLKNTIKRLAKKLPDFDFSLYKKQLEKIQADHQIANIEWLKLSAIDDLTQQLSLIADQKIIIKYDRAFAGFWRNFMFLQQDVYDTHSDVDLLKEVMAQDEDPIEKRLLQIQLRQFHKQYDKALHLTELFLAQEFASYLLEATVYQDSQVAYLTELNRDSSVIKMRKAMELLEDRVNEWRQYLPTSKLLLDYQTRMPSIVADHNLAITSGRTRQQKRIQQATESAQPISSTLQQNRAIQMSIEKKALSFFKRYRRRISYFIDDNIVIEQVMTLPLQITPWQQGTWLEKNQAHKKQKAEFALVGQDKDGNCHAILLWVEKEEEGQVAKASAKKITLTLPKAKNMALDVINSTPQYPLLCTNVGH